ncbi:alpha-galactosidase I from Mortierella Vinacea [Powellomyces hirtus]|nr:alpha-galactosidase I from Mortierella Vinacea [Powellomyces hirtus]
MGWNSWNSFHCNEIDEKLIRDTADILVSSGLAAVGYTYLTIDDCWSSGRDPKTGDLVADPQKFPSGMASLGAHIHSRGLKFGIYSSAGTRTCNAPADTGSLGREAQDAKLWASWGVDYLKYDNCFNEGQYGTEEKSFERYKKMADALLATGRPIYYSLCNWGQDFPWKWASKIGNSWRTTGDIGPSWNTPSPYCKCTVAGCDAYGSVNCPIMNILDKNIGLEPYASPTLGWNDMDMLEVGNAGMTTAEQLSHFVLWAVMKSPLILGNDLRTMDKATRTILAAREIVAVNQDPLGVPARLVQDWGKRQQVFAGPLVDGHVVVLLNRDSVPAKITASFDKIGLTSTTTARVRDLWRRQDIGTATGSFTVDAVLPHSVIIVKLQV